MKILSLTFRYSRVLMSPLLQSPTELQAYDQWVKQHPHGTLWQSLEWKKYREACGKEVRIYGTAGEATALVVIDKTSFGLSTWEIARAPLVREEKGEKKDEQLLVSIMSEAKKESCMSLYWTAPKDTHLSSFFSHISNRHVQPEATRIIDLRLPEAEILAQMHEKGRYNIKVAQKHGVIIKESQDIDAYYELATQTGGRDGFRILPKKSYENFLKHLPGSFLMLASTPEGKVIAGILGVIWNGTGIYYYGASSSEHRNLMAPYLLQWEAMKKCKAENCHSYDLLGVAPENAKPNHPWQGISSFKAKFGGQLINYPPEQEKVLKPWAKMAISLKRKLVG